MYMYLCKAEQRTETLGRKRQRTYILIYGDAMTHNFLEVNLLTQSFKDTKMRKLIIFYYLISRDEIKWSSIDGSHHCLPALVAF